jgi:sterol desaturase/sphingolipid hydroxylase (fatty acid hydroxylase superfamily)
MNEGFFSQFQFSEAAVRLTVFLAVFAAMAAWEIAAPRRMPAAARTSRWFANVSITVIGILMVRLIFLVVPVSVSILARAKGWGLLNMFEMPTWLNIIAGVVLLDLVMYLQHVMFHIMPPLWKLHLVHHTDMDTDVTTGLRFHPFESIISTAIRLAAVSLIGPHPLAVVIFEIILNSAVMFNHGNVRMPEGVDRVLRYAVVTPDMHRVHHSVNIRETISNFGFILPWWDRVFSTYRGQPAAGHDEMEIGLARYRDPNYLSLYRLLVLPLSADPGGYDISGLGREPDSKVESRKTKVESKK